MKCVVKIRTPRKRPTVDATPRLPEYGRLEIVRMLWVELADRDESSPCKRKMKKEAIRDFFPLLFFRKRHYLKIQFESYLGNSVRIVLNYVLY